MKRASPISDGTVFPFCFKVLCSWRNSATGRECGRGLDYSNSDNKMSISLVLKNRRRSTPFSMSRSVSFNSAMKIRKRFVNPPAGIAGFRGTVVY